MKARYLTSVFCAAFIVTSCSDRGQEMEVKVTQMQRQLDEAQKQLQAANQALASRAPAAATETSAASSTTGGLPSRDAVEQSYSASVTAFRRDLDANLKNFRVESCTTHSVQMPTEFYPFTSQLSLALVSTDGKNFTTDIPVKADVTGKWIFPTVAEVTQRIEKVNHAASAANTSRSTAQNQTDLRPTGAVYESGRHFCHSMAGFECEYDEGRGGNACSGRKRANSRRPGSRSASTATCSPLPLKRLSPAPIR